MAKFLSPSQVAKWRILNQIPGWDIMSPFGAKSRQLFLTIDPPFIPEKEALIFDVRICDGWTCPECRITKVSYGSTLLRSGFFFATEARLLFGNTDRNIVLQIPYETITGVYANNDEYTLAVDSDVQVIIQTKIPRPSLLGALAILGAPPGQKQFHMNIEQRKVNISQEFVTHFAGFFTEIVDKNRGMPDA